MKEERKDGRKNRWRVGDVTGGKKEELREEEEEDKECRYTVDVLGQHNTRLVKESAHH